MLDKVVGISIEGKCFEKQQHLALFVETDENDKFKKNKGNNKYRISILYGKNGSGKTTISKAFLNIIQQPTDDSFKCHLLDENENKIELINPNEKIFVFNDDYIVKNIKINDDGLESIVLVGKQVELQYKIEKFQKYLTIIDKQIEQVDNILETYQDKKSNNPNKIMAMIMANFKNNWAIIDSKIIGNIKRSTVTEESIISLYKENPLEQYDQEEILQQFDHLNEHVFKQIIWKEEYNNPLLQYTIGNKENDLLKLLSKEFHQQKSSDFEMIIKKIIQENKNFPNIQTRLKDPNFITCPYCYQELTTQYKQDIDTILKHIFDTEIKEYQDELDRFNFQFEPIDFSLYEELDKDKSKKIKQQVNKCLKIKTKYNELIIQKRNNPFIKDNYESLGLENELIELNKMIIELEKVRETQYTIQTNKQGQLQLFKKINTIKNLFDNIELFQNYCDLKDKKNKLEKNKIIYLNNKKRINVLINDYKSQMQDVKLATEHINYALQYIFFEKDRLQVSVQDGKYYLKSNGKGVHHKNISTGETNILALCYFFTQIFKDKEITELYKNEVLLILDDPISSFDMNNKIGILSYLQYMIRNFILNNSESKILILSHDLPLVSDLKKTCEEVTSIVKGNAKYTATTISKQLFDHKTVGLEFKNEYIRLLNKAYEYATSKIDEPSIGNMVRRLFEAYATFNFQKGIEKVLSFDLIKDKLGNKSDFFINVMSRIVLHQESHYEDQIKYMFNDFAFFGYISEDEKRKTVQYILSFMYLVSKEHILACLDIPNVSNQIETWISELPDNI